MGRKTTDENTSLMGLGVHEFLKNKKKIYELAMLIKFISLSIPYYKNTSVELPLIINLLEVVIFELYYENTSTAFWGLSLIPLLSLKNIQIIDNEGFKIWVILYSIWFLGLDKNSKGIKGVEIPTSVLFSHVYPTLHTILFSFGFTTNELLAMFALMRSASSRSLIMNNL